MSNGFSGRARVPDHVVHRAFDEKTVLLNLRSGQYHGLNRTAARMLELLEESGDLSQVAERMAAEYGRPQEEISGDLVELCASLAERGLIEMDDARADG